MFQITKLKIDSNPFAKGFRDSSRLLDFDRENMENFFEQRNLRPPHIPIQPPNSETDQKPETHDIETPLKASQGAPLMPLYALHALRQQQQQHLPQQLQLWAQWVQFQQHLQSVIVSHIRQRMASMEQNDLNQGEESGLPDSKDELDRESSGSPDPSTCWFE